MDQFFPALLFLGAANDLDAKTAHGIAHWRRESCIGQMRLAGGTADLGLPDLSPAEAARRGARSLIIGIANVGGFIDASWHPAITEALAAGLNIASGLHDRLTGIAPLSDAAREYNRTLFDVRHPDKSWLVIGTGVKRTGNRLLTVGTDCAVGKMFTSLAITREMARRGGKATFRATGQTGILIAGSGVSVDAVVSDFVAGAAEKLTPANDPDHWDVIEGQGSLFHPAYAGVSLGLLHGSQPDALVLCHDAVRTEVDGAETYRLPSLREAIELNEIAASRTNPRARFVGISVNTSSLSQADALAYLARVEGELGLPCCDPVRTGVASIVDHLLAGTHR